MTQYLISFDDGAMTFPEEELPDVAEAARGGPRGHGSRRGGFQRRTGKPEGERRGHRRDGHRRPVPGDQGVSLAMKLLAIRFARSNGYHCLRTFHHPHNANAIGMNRRLGFVDAR